MAFGFEEGRENPHETIYDGYKGKAVRIDVAGDIGGTGILKGCDPYGAGHIFYLSPHIFFINGVLEVSGDEAMINTNGNPVSIYPLGRTLERYVEETKAFKDKEKGSR